MDQSENNWQQDAAAEQAQPSPGPDFVSNSPGYRPGFLYDDENSQAMAAAMVLGHAHRSTPCSSDIMLFHWCLM